MAKLKPSLSGGYPVGEPVARWEGNTPNPPKVVPKPPPLVRLKTSLPPLPSVTALYHKPRGAGR